MSFSDLDLMALELLAHRPDTRMIRKAMLLSLLESGLVERRDGKLVVTFRGHAALLQRNTKPAQVA